MMRSLLGFCMVCLFLSPAFAGTEDWNGRWTGTGRIDSVENSQPITSQIGLEIQLTADRLTLHECWSAEQGSCEETTYRLEGGDQIFSGERKVGDIFPDRILILTSNAQVSEQFVIERNEKGDVRYRYSYVNFDGASILRAAQLSPLVGGMK